LLFGSATRTVAVRSAGMTAFYQSAPTGGMK